jgi:hypothetical protein
MKKKQKKYDPLKLAKKVRRELEIKEHGKQVSFRRTSTFKSKKDYKRNNKVLLENYED